MAVVQRVSMAHVSVDGAEVGRIEHGLVALVAVVGGDTADDVRWMSAKLLGLRIFRHGEKHFDLDVKQVGGSIMLVSNFTVSADTAQGRRPSLSRAADPVLAQRLFNALLDSLAPSGVPIATGVFGAEMLVNLRNDGPATFVLDSQS
jgi:D-tyrosyl-tRNA(Tyr) deacylase